MFPGVCSCHYTAIYPKFAEVCAAHGVKLEVQPSIWSTARLMLKHVRSNMKQNGRPE